MKKDLRILLLTMLIIPYGLYGQQKLETNKLANQSLVVASPTATGLGIFGQTPISPFTGTPSINIPLYEVAYKELSVDLSLRYHHGIGSKPDAFPGSTGNGFVLESGGVITRVTRGVTPANYPSGTILPINFNPTADTDWSSTAKMQTYIQTQTVFYNDNGRYDEYSYSFGGKSGKFYIDHTDAFRIKTAQGEDILVEKDPALTSKNFTLPTEPQIPTSCITTPYTNILNQRNFIYRFVLTDSEGIKYTFGGKDESIEFTRPGMAHGTFDVDNQNTIPTSWYLTSIESPNGYKIELNYKRDRFYITNEIAVNDKIILPSKWADNDNSPAGKVIKSTLYHPCYLDEIITPISKVKFNWSIASAQLGYSFTSPTSCSSPTDNSQIYFYAYPEIKDASLTGRFPNKLDNFVVSSTLGNRKKKVEFTYTNSTTTRLKLLSVKIRGDSDTPKNIPVYSFEYNSTPLPDYLSFKTDDFGFYNNNNPYITSNNPTDYYNLFTNATTRQLYLDSRKPNITYTSAEILQKVVYPTSGYSEYEYENNQYGSIAKFWPASIVTNTSGPEYTGGLRIKRITDYDYAGHVATEKKYFYKQKYATGGTASSGVLSFEPDHYAYFNGPVTAPARWAGTSGAPNFTGTMTYTRYSTDALNAASYKATHITYSEVTETNLDGSYTVFKYKNYDNGYHDKQAENYISDNSNVGSFWKDDEMNSLEIERGQPLSEEIYNSSNSLKQRNVYAYNTSATRFDSNVRRLKAISNPIFTANYPSLRYTASLIYTYFPYLTTKTVTNYEAGDSTSNIQTYTFNEANRLLISQTSINSKGQTVTVSNKYAPDYPADAISLAMKNKHMIAPVVETTTSVGGVQVNSLHTTYYSPSAGIYVPQQVAVQNGTNPVEIRQKFTQYDSKGNLLEQQKPNDVKETYLWGYNGQYLMAKVLGSDYSTVNALNNQTILDNGEANEAVIPTQLNVIRTSLATSNPIAQVTTYTYTGSMLKGLYSVTDPNNKATVYQYDALGRLSNINNADGSARASFCYNYAGQPTDCATVAPAGSIAASGLVLIAIPAPLPVTLIDFKAVKMEKTAVLSWSTTSETNSERFDIERSKDGKKWVKLGSVPSHSESADLLNYSFTDNSPGNGENLYRLKMHDKDGTSAYSRIQSVTFEKNGNTTLYPNPITIGEKLNLLTDDLDKVASIKIFSSAGKLLLQSPAAKQVNTSGLSPGLYMVQITYTDGSLSTHRIVKQ